MTRPALRSGHARLLLLLALVLLPLWVYWPVVGFGFTGLDDPDYVSSNPHVLEGITLRGVLWAFSTFSAANWHPLTWLSLMIDASIGGSAPAVYHTTNLLLHLVNTVLLFLALDRMTKCPGRSALVAALFAVHPQHVESVAWVAERKDVLSAAFWFLTLLAHARYAARPSAGRYAAVAASFACALMAKPMAVTLPLVLLLLDFWPLERFRPGFNRRASRARAWPLVIEKLPLLALAAASSAITLVAQSRGRTMTTLEVLPLWARAANSVVSYAMYLVKALWPSGLAIYYAHPGKAIGATGVVLALAALVALTVLSSRAFRTRPYLTFGWLWYLVTLLPVIGLVQVGVQARADRYTYIPLIGIFVGATWAGAEAFAALAERASAGRAAGQRSAGSPATAASAAGPPASITRAGSRSKAVALTALAGAVLLPLMGAAHVQVGVWRDRQSLFRRLTEVEPDRAADHNTLGTILFTEDALDEAMQEFRRAIELDPRHAGAHNNLALALQRQGKDDEALREFQEAIRLKPRYAKAHEHLARLLLTLGKRPEAVQYFTESIRLGPDLATTHAGLAGALLETGDARGAALHAQEALRLEPRLIEPHMVLGAALMLQSDFAGAVEHFSRAVAIDPDLADARANLAGALIEKGRLEEAIEQCREALHLLPSHTGARTNLALALLKQGSRDEARRELSEVLRLTPNDARARRYLQQIDSAP